MSPLAAPVEKYRGSWSIFFTNPISAVLLALAALSLIQATPWYTNWKKARQAKKSA